MGISSDEDRWRYPTSSSSLHSVISSDKDLIHWTIVIWEGGGEQTWISFVMIGVIGMAMSIMLTSSTNFFPWNLFQVTWSVILLTLRIAIFAFLWIYKESRDIFSTRTTTISFDLFLDYFLLYLPLTLEDWKHANHCTSLLSRNYLLWCHPIGSLVHKVTQANWPIPQE